MSQNTKKILVLGHVWPQPKASAAGEHLLHIIQLCIANDYRVHFATAATAPDNYDYTILENLSIKYTSVEINADSFDPFILELQPEIVLYDRFMTEEQFSWRVKTRLPNCLNILDTEDLHFLRKQRESAYKNNKVERLTDIAKRELASMYRCDVSLIISKAEKELLIKKYNIPTQLLYYLPLLSHFNELTTLPTFENRKDVVFIGNFLHEPNWAAVQELKKIWPKLRKLNKEMALHIYGAYAAPKHLQLHNPKEKFYVHGFVEDANKVLKNARLLVAPLTFGAGQKGKILKAFECGTPVITTKIGAEGMHFNTSWPGKIENDSEKFVQAVNTLYNDKILWQLAQSEIPKLLHTHFSYAQHARRFSNFLSDLMMNKDAYRAQNITGSILWHHSLRSTEFMSRWIMEKNKE